MGEVFPERTVEWEPRIVGGRSELAEDQPPTEVESQPEPEVADDGL